MEDFKEAVMSSRITEDLRMKARQVYAVWRTTALQAYRLGNNLPVDIPMSVVEESFLIQLADALTDLTQVESSVSWARPQWSHDYLCMHVRTIINKIWIDTAINDCCKNYVEMDMLRTIRESCKSDRSLVDALYDDYCSIDSSRVGEGFALSGDVEAEESSPTVVPITLHKDSLIAKKYSFKQAFMDSLSDDIQCVYKKLVERQTLMCCPNLQRYLSLDLVKLLAGAKYFN